MSDDWFDAPAITVRKSVQVYGLYDDNSRDPAHDRWDGSARALGKLLLEEMSDGSWREASTGEALSHAWVAIDGIEVSRLDTASGIVFWPYPGEVVKAGIVSDWVGTAVDQRNLRALLARAGKVAK